jgi:ABC-type transporter Mla MlaB component
VPFAVVPIPPLAHLGHWYVSLPVFMGPVLLLALALKVQTWREGRQERDGAGGRPVSVLGDGHGRADAIALTGPLDYPALLEIESELAMAAVREGAIVLDLRGVTDADQEAAWGLCDAIGRTRTAGRTRVLLPRSPHVEALVQTCSSEGIEISRGGATSEYRS